MSLAQNVNSLADAVGKAIGKANVQIEQNHAQITTLESSVNSFLTALEQAEAVIQRAKTKVIISDIDPGEGAPLETDAIYVVVTDSAVQGETE